MAAPWTGWKGSATSSTALDHNHQENDSEEAHSRQSGLEVSALGLGYMGISFGYGRRNLFVTSFFRQNKAERREEQETKKD
jgi:hypothetical protein